MGLIQQRLKRIWIEGLVQWSKKPGFWKELFIAVILAV